MTATTNLVTFDGTAQQFPAPPTAIGGLVAGIRFEPLRSNGAGNTIGTSAVTNDGTGTGVIREIAQPPAATVPLDSWELFDYAGSNRIDPRQFYYRGTSTQKAKITYYQN